MTVAQGAVMTDFSNFGAYDSNQGDDTAGIYNIVDGFAAVQVADASLLSGAAAVTANGTGGTDLTADTMNMSVLNVAATIDGKDGDDIITGTDYSDTIDGGAGTDTYVASGGTAISVTLNTSTDATVTVTGGADDTIVNVENVTGTSGDDTITGDSADNTIVGGAGADTLTGGAGADTLTGGDGEDIFVVGASATDVVTYAGADTDASNIEAIIDFVVADDTIQITDTVTFAGLTMAAGTSSATVSIGSAQIDAGADIDALTAAMQANTAGTASTADAAGLQAYVFETASGTDGLDGKTFLVINDGTAAIEATDVIIDITGVTGTLTSADFVIA
jgi:Ca2+-binding RTX toxin-like protein